MTTTVSQEAVEVTQADRLEASRVVQIAELGQSFIRGDYDHHPYVQAFARHRLSATPPAQTALVEALEGLSAEVRLLRMAVQADDPKREIILRVGDIDAATRAALSLATGERS